jgi:hypothetical protein
MRVRMLVWGVCAGVATSNLSLCINTQNGVWQREPPPADAPCEEYSRCPVNCTQDSHCAGHATGAAFCYGSVCRCRKGWSGPDCSVPELIPVPFCSGGFRDADGECCRGVCALGSLARAVVAPMGMWDHRLPACSGVRGVGVGCAPLVGAVHTCTRTHIVP